MIKIFYTSIHNFNSLEAIKLIFHKYFNIHEIEIFKNENGKPFLKNMPFFVSVTHSKEFCFIAISDINIGIDAEPIDRKVEYLPIIKRFSTMEKNEIKDKSTFLKHWTVKESVIKWLGGSISKDLWKLSYYNNNVYYNNLKIPVNIYSTSFKDNTISLCSENLNEDISFQLI